MREIRYIRRALDSNLKRTRRGIHAMRAIVCAAACVASLWLIAHEIYAPWTARIFVVVLCIATIARYVERAYNFEYVSGPHVIHIVTENLDI